MLLVQWQVGHRDRLQTLIPGALILEALILEALIPEALILEAHLPEALHPSKTSLIYNPGSHAPIRVSQAPLIHFIARPGVRSSTRATPCNNKE